MDHTFESLTWRTIRLDTYGLYLQGPWNLKGVYFKSILLSRHASLVSKVTAMTQKEID